MIAKTLKYNREMTKYIHLFSQLYEIIKYNTTVKMDNSNGVK